MFVAVEIDVLNRATLGRTTIRLCSHQTTALTGWDSKAWYPHLNDAGSIESQIFDGDFSSSVSMSTISLSVAERAFRESYPSQVSFQWEHSPVRLWAGDTVASMAQIMSGNLTRFERDGASIKLTAEAGAEVGSKQILTATYAGTGGIEGGENIKGKQKPWILGFVQNVEPVLVDATNNVFQLSAYSPIKSVTNLYERGADFGASIGDYANYAALVAATIPAGRWGTCIASGLVRLGAPPYGVITADVEGDYTGGVLAQTTGAIIQRIASVLSIPSGNIDAASMTALDTFSATLPQGGKIGIFITEQTTLIDLARRLCLPLNAQAGITMMGKLFACRIAIGSPTFTLEADGKRVPIVHSMIEGDINPPYKRISMGGVRSWRVHTKDEVALFSQPTPRGDYNAGTTYREGDVVTMPDGSTWIYINPVASSGNTPSAGVYWSALSAAAVFADRHEPAERVHNFVADYAGNLSSEDLPKTFSFKRMRGSADVSSSATWSIYSQTGVSGGTVTVSNGVATIPSGCTIAISAQIVVRSVLSGVTVSSIINIARSDGAPPSSGGSGGGTSVQDSTLGSFSSTTFATISDTMTVHTGSSGVVTLSAPLQVTVASNSPTGSFEAEIRWRIKPAAGSYTDQTAAASDPDAYVETESGVYFGYPGGVTSNVTVSGLTANADYVVELQARRTSASPTRTLGLAGTITAVGS